MMMIIINKLKAIGLKLYILPGNLKSVADNGLGIESDGGISEIM